LQTAKEVANRVAIKKSERFPFVIDFTSTSLTGREQGKKILRSRE
jgi:hypothetical protein